MVFHTVCVADHKTGKTERAKLVFDNDIHTLLQKWMKVREAIIVPECPYVFPNFWSAKLTDLTTLVNSFAERAGFTLPNPRTMRTVVEVKSTCLPPEEKQAIARSLCHSNETAERHYRALEKDKRIMAYKSVGSILGAPVTSKETSVVPKRRLFSARENDLVMDGFMDQIAERILPTKEETKAFLAEHQPNGLFIGRKPHDLYDKIRNIIGRKNLKK